MEIQKKIGDNLKSFGGHLQCRECGIKQPLGDIGHKMAHGWPKCCGYTMRWITDNEIEKEDTQ